MSRRPGLTLLELVIVLVILTALGTLLVPTMSSIGQRSQVLTTQETLRRLRETLINQYEVDMGELPRPRADIAAAGTRPDHPQLVYLFVNPDTHEDGDSTNDWEQAQATVLSGRRWQGPYVQHSGMEYFVTDSDSDPSMGTNFTSRYGLGDAATRVGDPTVIDAWGNPIIIQEPATAADDELDRRHTRLVSAGRDGRISTDPDILMPTLAQRGDDQILFLYRADENNDRMLDLSQ